jgi:hypothetical protein
LYNIDVETKGSAKRKRITLGDTDSSSPSSHTKMSSLVLETLLKNSGLDWNDFLETIWEQKCHRFVFCEEGSGSVWTEIVGDGLRVLTQLMNDEYQVNEDRLQQKSSAATSNSVDPPLLFRSLQPMDDPEEIQKLYNNSLYAAFLAGTSIVWNHVDLRSSRIAALCGDLQGEGSEAGPSSGAGERNCCFPHAYANAYLTPPRSQTVPPHADDRDVLVFQLAGHKRWKVYEERPILHPYTHEQVGKSGIKVPDSVLKGPRAFDGCLRKGDVLYVPRGMVHEASTDTNDSAPDFSFHITVAIATHDWTLGGNLSRTIQAKLLNTVSSLTSSDTTNLRRSLLPTCRKKKCDGEKPGANEKRISPSDSISCGGFLVDKRTIQKDIDAIFERLRTEVTAESLLKDLDLRIQIHNEQASEERSKLISSQAQTESQSQTNPGPISDPLDFVVGPIAAKVVSLETLIRASTPIEREHAQKMFLDASSSASAGLNVRDEIGDDVATIVIKIKEQQSQSVTFRVGDFWELLGGDEEGRSQSMVCDLTSLSLAKRAVELGAFTIADGSSSESERLTKRIRTT